MQNSIKVKKKKTFNLYLGRYMLQSSVRETCLLIDVGTIVIHHAHLTMFVIQLFKI